MSYGYVYVARVAMGANDQQTLRAFLEAESYDGPSLIIAYSSLHCARLRSGKESRTAETGRTVRALADVSLRPTPGRRRDKNPLIIESKEPSIPISQYAYNETRYKMLIQMDEARAEKLMQEAQHDAKSRWTLYQQMAAMHYGNGKRNGKKNK